MKGLVDLQITIYDLGLQISEKDLLGPLMKVTGLNNFELELPWPEEWAINPVEGDLPFRIRRPMPDEHNTIVFGVSYGGRRTFLGRVLDVASGNRLRTRC